MLTPTGVRSLSSDETMIDSLRSVPSNPPNATCTSPMTTDSQVLAASNLSDGPANTQRGDVSPQNDRPSDRRWSVVRNVTSAFGPPGNHLHALHNSAKRQYTLSGIQLLFLLIPATSTVVSAVIQCLQYYQSIKQGASQNAPGSSQSQSLQPDPVEEAQAAATVRRRVPTSLGCDCQEARAPSNMSSLLGSKVERRTVLPVIGNIIGRFAYSENDNRLNLNQQAPQPPYIALLTTLVVAVAFIQFVKSKLLASNSLRKWVPRCITQVKRFLKDDARSKTVPHKVHYEFGTSLAPKSPSRQGVSSSVHQSGSITTLRHRRQKPHLHISRIWDLAFQGSGIAVEQLLIEDPDFDINSVDNSNEYGTVLAAAARGGHKDIINSLIFSHAANVNVGGGRYLTALQSAAHSGHSGIVRTLLNVGASTAVVGGAYGSALAAAIGKGSLDLVKALLPHRPADRKAVLAAVGPKCGYSPLMQAAAQGNAELIDLFLMHGADPNAHNTDGTTALHVAVQNKRYASAKRLLEGGAAVDPSPGINLPFDLAMEDALETGDEDLAILLLDWNTHVFRTNDRDKTPLHLIADARFPMDRLAGALIRRCSVKELDDTDDDGCSALHYAVINGHTGIAKLLISRGADKSIRGLPWSSDAISKQLRELLRGMCRRPAPPLTWAALMGQRDMINLLLETPDDVNSCQDLAQPAPPLSPAIEIHVTTESLLLLVSDILVGSNKQEWRGLLEAKQYNVDLPMPVILKDMVQIDVLRKGRQSTLCAALRALRFSSNPAFQALRLSSNLARVSSEMRQFIHLLLDQLGAGTRFEAMLSVKSATLAEAAAAGDLHIVQRLLHLAPHAAFEVAGECVHGGVLQAAVCGGNIEVLRLLLAPHWKVDVNQLGGPCGTALGAAVARGTPEMVALLLTRGADVNLTPADCDSPLKLAIRRCKVRVGELLLAQKPEGVSEALAYLRRNIVQALERGHERRRRRLAGMMVLFNVHKAQRESPDMSWLDLYALLNDEFD